MMSRQRERCNIKLNVEKTEKHETPRPPPPTQAIKKILHR